MLVVRIRVIYVKKLLARFWGDSVHERVLELDCTMSTWLIIKIYNVDMCSSRLQLHHGHAQIHVIEACMLRCIYVL